MKRTDQIPYSILELAAVSKGKAIGQVYKDSLDLAQHAEKLGYHRFWLAEHHNMISIASSATPVLIGHIAEGTESIRVGSGGIMLPNHSPLIVSEQFGTLAHLHPGRIDLGLGRAPGTDQTTAYAIRPDRMQSVYNFPNEVEQIQQFFSDNRGAQVRAYVAENQEVPVYILGSSTDSAVLAAKMGLPYAFASHFAPAMLFEALDIYRSNFKPSEYLDKPYVIGLVNVIAADTDSEAERLSTSLIRMFLGILTNQRDYMQPPEAFTDQHRALLNDPAFQRMLRYAFIGSKDTVREMTKSFLKETGADEIMVASHVYDHSARLHSYSLFAEAMQEIGELNPV
ncbi:LLM class flavin-dependent oxidoreductase [Roseivirga sp. BDSF3-8]|uniref:LLM class flavin-dependent oxidoreductase n=1 Tax=Roseivirga sp. BDSF3-8 TaxID=3241598 RepID=UPI0035318A38